MVYLLCAGAAPLFGKLLLLFVSGGPSSSFTVANSAPFVLTFFFFNYGVYKIMPSTGESSLPYRVSGRSRPCEPMAKRHFCAWKVPPCGRDLFSLFEEVCCGCGGNRRKHGCSSWRWRRALHSRKLRLSCCDFQWERSEGREWVMNTQRSLSLYQMIHRTSPGFLVLEKGFLLLCFNVGCDCCCIPPPGGKEQCNE